MAMLPPDEHVRAAIEGCGWSMVDPRPISADMSRYHDFIAHSGGELKLRVESAMAELSDDQRAILILRAYHDLDYPEIASALGIEAGAPDPRDQAPLRAGQSGHQGHFPSDP